MDALLDALATGVGGSSASWPGRKRHWPRSSAADRRLTIASSPSQRTPDGHSAALASSCHGAVARPRLVEQLFLRQAIRQTREDVTVDSKALWSPARASAWFLLASVRSSAR